MKLYHILILVVACFSNSLIAGPLQISLEVKLENVDKKWLSDVGQLAQGEVIKVPKVLARFSEEAKTEVLKAYITQPVSGKNVETLCGFTMQLTPKLNTDGIALNGSMIFRRSLDARAGNIATQFEASETLIGCVLKNGKETKIKLAAGGSALITATLLDAAGKPAKLNIEQDVALNR